MRLQAALRGELRRVMTAEIGAGERAAPLLIGVFARGARIRPARARTLAIPLPAAGRRATPAAWQQAHGQKLRCVARRGRPALLVADNARLTRAGGAVGRKGKGRARQTIPVFVLVPQVTIRKRLDIDGAARHWAGAIPGLVAAAWQTPPRFEYDGYAP